MTRSPWHELASDSGRLLEIRGDRERPGRYTALAFVFDHGVATLTCDGDTDEIVVGVSRESPDGLLLVESDPALDGLTGLVIDYVWTMENQRGYRDAVQIRLLALDSREEQTRQFEVAASAMTISRVSEI